MDFLMIRVGEKSVWLLLVFVVAVGCTPQPTTNETDAAPKATQPVLLTTEEVANVRQAVEQCGGTVRLDDRGQPIAIDLAVGRCSTDVAAFEAAIGCTQLQSFRARAGQIATDDLRKLATLSALEELFLQDAALNDDVLGELVQGLSGLRRLTLRNTPQVTDVGIATLAELVQLERLALIDLQISGEAIPTLSKLPALVSLDLRQCKQIAGAALAPLSNAPALKELKLSGYDIDDATLGIVASLPRLESLTVEDASITSEGIGKLAENPQTAQRIRSLTFARCSALDDDALATLAAFGNLRRLTLRDVPITGSCLTKLPMLGQLELLSLNELFLGDEAFQAFAACQRLKRLELAQNLLTPAAVETIGKLANLEYLNLTDCGLDDEMLQPLAKLSKLRTLIVNGNPNVTPETAARLIQTSK
jgi:Leucine-rich repeat (LRR) protein